MKISARTIRKFLDDRGWEWASEYGEPGYSARGDETPLVVFGSYWINHTDPRNRETNARFDSWDRRYPRFWAQLEEQGVSFEWSDEWVEIDGKAYRCQPDSYSWQPSYIDVDGDRYVLDNEDPDMALIESIYTNETHRALNVENFDVKHLTDAGWLKFNGSYAAGWYDGQDDDPQACTETVRKQFPGADILFVIEGVGQFDIHWQTYYRPVALTRTTKIFRTWRDRIESGTITHPQASQFGKAVYTKAYGLVQSGKACAVTAPEASVLVNLVRHHQPLVLDERLNYSHPGMTTYAIARSWLKRQAKRVDMPDMPWDDIVDFRLVDFHNYGSNGWRSAIYPVYEARFADGHKLRYSPTPWQAGMSAAKVSNNIFWEVAA